MQKYANFIRNVEVKYYRSINSAKVRNCSPINIVTGPNDIGKSNFLRALNLFFNETDPLGDDIDFTSEFSQKRLEVVRKESVKGKQFIQVAIDFNRGPFFENTLPPKFKVIKTWFRDSASPTWSDDLPAQIKSGKLNTTIVKARISLQKFLNRIQFTYIPAIKDSETFGDILGRLQENIFDANQKAGSSLTGQIASFNLELEKEAAELREDFIKSTGIKAEISLPLSLGELFQSFNIRTDGVGGEFVSLDKRGDGIRVRFLPAIMNYIAERSSKQHIWGFEEPENSMEFKRAFELSETMRQRYSKSAQIFITTHSPAFIDLSRDGQSLYVARREDDATTFHEVNAKSALALFDGDAELGLAEELGHIALMGKLHQQLSDAIVEANAVKAAGLMVQEELENFKRPLLLMEGRSDPYIISQAWQHLRGGDMPYTVRSCNTLPDDDAGEAAGAGVLAGALKTVRADAPHVTVGIFDHDVEGIGQFKLDKNFVVIAGHSGAKVHKNGKSIALLIPAPAGYEGMVQAENLPIEFLFEKKYLDVKVDGHGLQVGFHDIVELCAGKKISAKPSDKPEHMHILGGKVYFAKKVVPTLPKEAFVGFEPLLELIEAVVKAKEPAAAA